MKHTKTITLTTIALALLGTTGCAEIEQGKEAYKTTSSSAQSIKDKITGTTNDAPVANPNVTLNPNPQTIATPEEINTAKELLGTLPVNHQDSSGFNRTKQFGKAWDYDYNNNGCDTRDDILARDLTNAVTSDGCKVTAGTLQDPYTNTTINFKRGKDTSADVQIDHIIALNEAWGSGANQWDQQTREQFANDPANLMAVDGPTNGSKSAKDAAKYVPDNEEFVCTYVTRQITLKAHYGLSVDKAESKALNNIMEGC